LDGDNKEPQQIAPPYPVRPRDARPHWSGEHDVVPRIYHLHLYPVCATLST